MGYAPLLRDDACSLLLRKSTLTGGEPRNSESSGQFQDTL